MATLLVRRKYSISIWRCPGGLARCGLMQALRDVALHRVFDS
jgi:hypothetical protein